MLLYPLKNDRGVALVFMVLFFTAAVTAVVMFISLGVKIKGIQREGTTEQRLTEIRTALQNYYLIQYDLPDPSLTIPPNSVPTDLLNLPQKYRFDSNGQLIFYDRTPVSGHMTTVRNVYVHGPNNANLVAAVLVAPGPDKNIDPNNQSSPYDDPANPANDDIVLAVSLEAEALKIANHTVAILQQTAKAYDSIFYAKNNDMDTLYYPPETRWVDLTQPTPGQDWLQTGVDAQGDPVYGWVANGTYHTNYSGGNFYTYVANDTTDPNGGSILTSQIGPGDEYVEPFPQDPPFFIPQQPEAIIDEDGYVPSQGGTGSGCVHISNVTGTPGVMLSNDPDRGVASLDTCSSGTPAYDLAVVYGLNLVKLGYNLDFLNPQILDPWGNLYLWGAASSYGGLPSSDTAWNDQHIRDHHYWTFFSTGPDALRDTPDDILPPADRIPGYFLTPSIANPIP